MNPYYQQLFNFAIQHSNPEELRNQASNTNEQSQQPQPLTEHQKEVLEYMIEQMKGKDPIKLMKENLNIIYNIESTIDETLTALENIDDIVTKIDFAIDLDTLNGTKFIIEHFLTKEIEEDKRSIIDNEVELFALQVISTCLHNNSNLQVKELYQNKLFNYLENNLINYKNLNNNNLLKKIGTCLVSLCSNQPITLQKYIDRNILKYILNILQDDTLNEQIKSKYMFCILNMLYSDENYFILGKEINNLWNEFKPIATTFLKDVNRKDLLEKTILVLRELNIYKEKNNY
ncbi:hypothetical protein ABK040_008864 [Willaertia magna]